MRPNYIPISPNAIMDARAQAALTRASQRISRYLAVLPDIEETAFHLTERELFALTGAYQTRSGWRVRIEFQVELAREGLCEVRVPHLTAYGIAVRRFIMQVGT